VSSFVAPVLEEDEEELELSLRPRRLDDFVGQERVKEQLQIALTAAKARGEALDAHHQGGDSGNHRSVDRHVDFAAARGAEHQVDLIPKLGDCFAEGCAADRGAVIQGGVVEEPLKADK